MEEVSVRTGNVVDGVYGVDLEVEEGATCREILYKIVDLLDLQSERGNLRLVEEWKGCKRLIPLDSRVFTGGTSTFHLHHLDLEEKLSQVVREDNIRKKKMRRLSRRFLQSSAVFLSGVPTFHQLHYIRWYLERRIDKAKRKYSATLLQRLGAGQPLWVPREKSLLDILILQLNSLEENNLSSSTTVSELNMQSTHLYQLILPLKRKAEQLLMELSGLSEEVKKRREQRERNAPTNVEQMRLELASLLKELEMKNQLNTRQNSKLQKLKDHLKMQRKVLEGKKKEIERLKRWGTESHDLNTPTQQPVSKIHQKNGSTINSIPKNTNEQIPLQRPPLKMGTALTSKKRIFAAKHRQWLEEEGQMFKQQLKLSQGQEVWSSKEGSGFSEAAQLDEKWYPDNVIINQHSLKSKQESLDADNTSTAKKCVRFEARSVVLNAALEGELDLLKECIRKLGGCGYTNDKGATCLHNAVCSGNIRAVSYLVEQSCDINAQDIDGWTPLHCAVACGNLAVTQYLVEHGASLFLTTRDGDTPLQIAAPKEYKLDSEDVMKSVSDSLHYLRDVENALGVVNGGVVYALFERRAKEAGELSLTEGERLTFLHCEQGNKWWTVENMHGQTGIVPYTFLGLYRRV